MSAKQPQKNNSAISEDEAKEKQSEKEKILELKKKKKEMEQELDELKGNTPEGKAKCALVFLLLTLVLFSVLLGLIKMNVGNFASDVLAPVIADVPVVRKVLPKDLQKKTEAEILAEQTATVSMNSETASQAGTASATMDQSETMDLGTEAQDGNNEEITASETTMQTMADSETAAQAEADALAEQEAQAEEAALADYVDTYSQMKPKDAAKVFDNMMPDQADLVVKILENLTPNQRAAILSKMNVNNASEITVKMEK